MSNGGGGGRGLLGFNWKCNCIGAYIWKKDAQCVYSRISKINTIPKFEKILFACLNRSALFSGICMYLVEVKKHVFYYIYILFSQSFRVSLGKKEGPNSEIRWESGILIARETQKWILLILHVKQMQEIYSLRGNKESKPRNGAMQPFGQPNIKNGKRAKFASKFKLCKGKKLFNF